MATSDLLIKRITNTYIGRDATGTAGATTLAAPADAGDTTIDVGAITNFADGDAIRIGSELNWVDGAPTSGQIALGRPLTQGHASGTAVVELTIYDVGPVLDSGVNWSLATPQVNVQVADRLVPFTRLKQNTQARIGWQSPAVTTHHMAFALGLALSRVAGSGTATAPYHFTTDGSEFGEATEQCYIAMAELVNGDEIAVEYWGCYGVVENLSLTLARGAVVPLPFLAQSTAGVLFEQGDLPYGFTPASTYKPTTGKVWDALSAVGLMVDTATTTSLNGAVAAGATSITLTSGASFNNDDWVKLSGANGVQYVQLTAKATDTFTTKQKIYRDLGSGITVTKVTPTPFATVGQGGVTMSLAVAGEAINDATKALPIYTRPGLATLSFGCGLTSVSLDNLALVLGVPASDIVTADRLKAFTDGIGTRIVDGMYFEGATKDGSVTRVVVNGCEVDIANFASTWTNTGQASELPFAVIATNAVTFEQYT